jgi:hypothetical protein
MLDLSTGHFQSGLSRTVTTHSGGGWVRLELRTPGCPVPEAIDNTVVIIVPTLVLTTSNRENAGTS